MIYEELDSPIGRLLLTGDGTKLTGLYMQEGPRPKAIPAGWQRTQFPHVRAQLQEYFAGDRRDFDLPLSPRGSEWELRVWSALREIPYGETVSYGELAARVCTPQAARAVGLANARNPIAVILPCHRVIGSDGRLTGFGGGLERKRALLELEAGIAALPVG